MARQQDARICARQILEQVADEHADSDDAGLYLAKIAVELFEMSPAMREHVSDFILVELVEELHRRGQPGRDASRLVEEVQRHWANERG